MELKYALLFCYVMNNVFIIDAKTISFMCNTTMANITSNEKILNLAEHCKDKPCIPKCCGLNEAIMKTVKKVGNITERYPICVSWSTLNNKMKNGLKIDTKSYSNVTIYTEKLEKTEKNFFKDFHVVRNRMFDNISCLDSWTENDFKLYLSEHGNFIMDMRPTKTSLTVKSPERFCVDLFYKRATKNESSKILIMYYTAKENGKNNDDELLFIGIASVITSFFLILVFLVYAVLPQLRNLSGMLLMAYVGTLFVTFVTKGIQIFYSQHMQCRPIATIFYFAFLSTFFWLNIMSYDIWWTFRGQRLKRAINRRGEVVKFGWYSLYGWGAPLAVTLMALIIDLQDTSKLSDNFVKPQFDTCLNSDKSIKYYMFLPIGILTSINLALFLMTIYNIWLIRRTLDQFNKSSASTKKNQNRFGLYIKMSMLMGTSWLLELVGVLWEDAPFWVFILINLYNAFIGLIIFIMFVANKKTLRMLCKRFNIQCRFIENREFDPNVSRSTTKSSTTRHGSYLKPATEDSDLEMTDTEVSTNPLGK